MSTTTQIKSKENKSSKKRKTTSEEDETKNVPELSPNETIEASTHEGVVEHKSEDEPEVTSPHLSKKRRISLPEEIEVDVSAPEPPSKRGLRRLKKGKSLPPSKSGADSSPEPEEQAQGSKSKEREKRSEHGIWIGNLPWTLSKEDLQKFLVDNSDITDEGITRIHMPAPADEGKGQQRRFARKQHNKGFAYVDFSSPEAVTHALGLSEQLLSGRRVLIKNKDSYEGRPEKPKEEEKTFVNGSGKAPSKRIFIGNLRYDTTQDILKEHFEQCGEVEMCFVATFEDSGKCKGYAWVTFAEIEDAEKAVKGWVLIPEEEEELLEELEDQEDKDEENDKEEVDEDEGEQETKTARKLKPRMKKVFVNKIYGRPLRIEFAEDPQTRYKKRFGKESKSKGPLSSESMPNTEGASAQVGEVQERSEVSKKGEHRTPWGHRLTGGIVESKGTKKVF